MYILVTYDVDTTDKDGQRRLRRVAKACLDYGQRVQNSVFECELTEVQLSILKDRIEDIINHSLDSIRFYHLNRNENRRVEVMGVETSFNVKDTIII
ncbi:MAG: CRISPR-associated endonuclease Cas2 [Bacteroidales bacterium]|nr:CRISPR-associated endonuclease Cas2 [Bacteroidales bacterium]